MAAGAILTPIIFALMGEDILFVLAGLPFGALLGLIVYQWIWPTSGPEPEDDE